MTPKEFVDSVAGEIKRIWDLMNTSYDKFIRTTDADHEKQVQKIFKKLYDQGDIYKGYYEGMYCTPCESFFTESQLVDGKCPDCGREVQPAKEEAYFFKMSKYADRLIEHINTHPEFIQPVSRKNEMMNNFLLPGLQDLCVSRTSFKWGIPVDFDPDHVVYVWLDALTNYITGIGYDCSGESTEQFQKNWPADLHLIGKDIIRFHTIYWPIFLMALGLPLPRQVFGHPWLLQGDGKMSKSKGNVLYADELVDFFGVDAVRYFVLHEMPFDNDGVISWELMVERMNSDLANTLGNLVNRTISMTNKYFGGAVTDKGAAEEVDADLKAVTGNMPAAVEKKMADLRVADAITEIFTLFKRCNKYIDETMPWALAKDEAKRDRLETVLFNLIGSIKAGARALEPFMPETSEKILAPARGRQSDGEAGDPLPEAGSGGSHEAGGGAAPGCGRDGGRGGCHRYRGEAGDHLRGIWKDAVPGGRDPGVRGSEEVQEAPLLQSPRGKPDQADRVRHQVQLYAGGNGGQESHGPCELKAREAGGRALGGHAAVRGGCGRQPGPCDAGEGYAGRGADQLDKEGKGEGDSLFSFLNLNKKFIFP